MMWYMTVLYSFPMFASHVNKYPYIVCVCVQLGQGDLMVMGGEREREAHTFVINLHAAALGMWEHHGSSSSSPHDSAKF